MRRVIDNVRSKIRYAYEPDNPGLINLWLKMEEENAPLCPLARWQLYVNESRLLLDVLADDLLPGHWRCLCLDYINRPLTALRRIAVTDDNRRQLNQLTYELRVTSHFFQAGITG